MNNQEYVIINKTDIEKRIEELEKTKYPGLRVDLDVLKQILSQSIPLNPEIEEAFRSGSRYGGEDQTYFALDYSKDLKLDI